MHVHSRQISVSDLNPDEAKLMEAATQSLKKSYAPYSNFNVGCAIALNNGHIVSGANQENAAFPQCLCAEQVALSAASALHPGHKIQSIFITASRLSAERVLAPCGQCRQTILEFENRQQHPIRIYMMKGTDAIVLVESAATLLPFAFSASHL